MGNQAGHNKLLQLPALPSLGGHLRNQWHHLPTLANWRPRHSHVLPAHRARTASQSLAPASSGCWCPESKARAPPVSIVLPGHSHVA